MTIISLKGDKELIQTIAEFNIEGVTLGTITSISSPSDVLDSPLNPNDFIDGIELIKIIFQTGTAAIAFSKSLIEILKLRKEKVTISNGKNKEEVDGDTDPKQLSNKLME